MKEEENKIMALVIDEKIKVIYKEPGKKCEIKEIGTSLKDYQNEVKGNIESIPFPGKDDVDIVLNDMGKLNGMKPNIVIPEYGDILMGPIFVVGVDERNCMWKSIPDEKIEELVNYMEDHVLTKEKEENVYERDEKSNESENEMEER